jgi:acetoin:2,6-dichlorophenolindophenol oxidoreductase subunit beta
MAGALGGISGHSDGGGRAMMTTMTLVEASRMALRREMARNKSVYVLGQDVRQGGIFGQYKGLADEFGADRIIDTPIAEATMVGSAVGAAMMGLRPIVETGCSDFALSAIDEIVNLAAETRFMSGGQATAPLVVRMPSGTRQGSAAQHSPSLEAWFVHIPGLVVAAPASPADAAGLLVSALRGGDPVIMIEAMDLWQVRGEVEDAGRPVPFGSARFLRRGNDATVVAWSAAVRAGVDAAALLGRHGVTIDLIDLRTLWPWDKAAVLESVSRTGRLIVAHESVRDGGFGAEIAATIAEELHDVLRAPVKRVASPRIPVGYALTLESLCRVTALQIALAVGAACEAPLDIEQPPRAHSAMTEFGASRG